jgi:hypothetical protein
MPTETAPAHGRSPRWNALSGEQNDGDKIGREGQLKTRGSRVCHLFSPLQIIRPRALVPGQRWKSARPGPHKTLGGERHFLNQGSSLPVFGKSAIPDSPVDGRGAGSANEMRALGNARVWPRWQKGVKIALKACCAIGRDDIRSNIFKRILLRVGETAP